MKLLTKILILVLFFIVVFIPRQTMGAVLYWSMFLMIAILVCVNFIVTYWVSRSGVRKARGRDISFSLFCTMLCETADVNNQMVKGRLVLDETGLYFYRRESDFGKLSLALEIPARDLEDFSFSQRNGKDAVVFSTEDSDSVFLSRKIQAKKDLMIDALRWVRID